MHKPVMSCTNESNVTCSCFKMALVPLFLFLKFFIKNIKDVLPQVFNILLLSLSDETRSVTSGMRFTLIHVSSWNIAIVIYNMVFTLMVYDIFAHCQYVSTHFTAMCTIFLTMLFVYTCAVDLDPKSPYSHFQSGGPCASRLFEGEVWTVAYH